MDEYTAKAVYGLQLQSMHKRVAKGARLLDLVEPRWYTRVDERLDMQRQSHCILSYVFGDYVYAMTQLDLPLSGPIDHGFTLPHRHNTAAKWAELNTLWLSATLARRANERKSA